MWIVLKKTFKYNAVCLIFVVEHYFTRNPSSEMREKKIIVSFSRKKFTLISSSGVFSKDKPDTASIILCEAAKSQISGKILDMGCGYGLIGICLLKFNPNLKITFSDVNERALELTKKNLILNKLKGEVIYSDGADNIKTKFDHVLLNPPMAAGRKICFKIINDAHNLLNNGGSLFVVARHQKGGKLIKEHMKEEFGNVNDAARKAGFHVYVSKKVR